jgi:peptidoglycan/xylan/chitin deacetylase (PgdA/CDA1 family)
MPPVAGMSGPPDNVRPDRFRTQLAGLLRRGFTVRPLRELLACNARGEPLPPRTIAITFDDGYQSFFHYAWPVLRDLDLPATAFLATAHVGAAAPFPFDPWGVAHAPCAPPVAYCPLTLGQCCEMAAEGLIDFGAHTHTHRDFRGCPAQFGEDLQTSVNFMRAALGVEDVMFAFPYGSRRRGFADAALVAAAKQTGVICGLTTEGALIEAASDSFQWGRFNVFPWDTDLTLTAKLGGWYVIPRRLLRRPRQVSGAERSLLRAASNFPRVGVPHKNMNTVSHR